MSATHCWVYVDDLMDGNINWKNNNELQNDLILVLMLVKIYDDVKYLILRDAIIRSIHAVLQLLIDVFVSLIFTILIMMHHLQQ